MRYTATVVIVRVQHAGCLEVLIQAEQTKSRVLKLIQGAEWQVVAKALGQLVHLNPPLRAVLSNMSACACLVLLRLCEKVKIT